LKSQPNVKKNRIGAIGWCMGGGYALDVALQDPTLAADVINYGHLATTQESLQKIHAPILGIFGGKDQGISVDDVKKFEQGLKAMGKTVEVHVYPEAGHGFENPVNASYRPNDAADAWQHTVHFLEETLKK
jgi:carboxymethylenebutenolidase